MNRIIDWTARTARKEPGGVKNLAALAVLASIIAVPNAIALGLHLPVVLDPPQIQTVAGKPVSYRERCRRKSPCNLIFELDVPALADTRFAASASLKSDGYERLASALFRRELLRLEYYDAACGRGPTCWPVSIATPSGTIFISRGIGQIDHIAGSIAMTAGSSAAALFSLAAWWRARRLPPSKGQNDATTGD